MPYQFKTLCVVGLGYIGLPTAAAFAARKIKVLGVDVNERAVQTINQGRIHIVEPELDMLVHAAVKEGYLRAATKAEPAMKRAPAKKRPAAKKRPPAKKRGAVP